MPAYDLGATLNRTYGIKETGLNPSEINEGIIGNVHKAGQKGQIQHELLL